MVLPLRKKEARLLAGVCAGLEEALVIDATLLRLAFILLSFAWGLGFLLYGLLWLGMSEEGSRRPVHLGDVARRNLASVPDNIALSSKRLQQAWQQFNKQPWPRPMTRRWIAGSLLGGGGLIVLVSLGAFAWLTPWRAVGLAVVAVGAAVLLTMRKT